MRVGGGEDRSRWTRIDGFWPTISQIFIKGYKQVPPLPKNEDNLCLRKSSFAYAFKGNNSLKSTKLEAFLENFLGMICLGEECTNLRLMSGADNEIKPVCKCHRDGRPEKASTSILLNPESLNSQMSAEG